MNQPGRISSEKHAIHEDFESQPKYWKSRLTAVNSTVFIHTHL